MNLTLNNGVELPALGFGVFQTPPDFRTGRTIQLSGTAAVDWTAAAVPGDGDATGRAVCFSTEQVVADGSGRYG